jgi:hypothetical protein
VLPSTGCQVEYAGMTLPSGKYMHDDVQYFAPGTDFPWANTQAATQRARMQALGMEVAGPGPGGPLVVAPAAGALPPVQFQGGRATDVNVAPMPPPPGGGGVVVPPPGGAMPAGAGEAAGPAGGAPPPSN